MLLPVLFYSSETMVWNKKYRSKVQCVQMDNLRGVLGVRRIDKMRNEHIRVLCGVKKGINERINESMLRLSLIHISEPTRLLSISYAVFCLKKKKNKLQKKKI